MNLYFLDHRHPVNLNYELNLAKIKTQNIINVLPSEVTKVDDKNLAHYAIIHLSNPTPENINSEFSQDQSKEDLQIFFCVTTSENLGYTGYSEKDYPHQKKQLENKTRYILYGRKLDDLNKVEVLEKVLKAFLSLSAEQAQAILDRDFDNIPKDLVNIFHLTKFENIAALSILCQGYLAVHRDTELYNQVKDLIVDVSSKATKTEEKDWWKKPFPNDSESTLTDKITAEWQPKDLPKKITKLIGAIYGNELITTTLVQDAYDLIVTRLV
jgi:hypothetical protein